MGLLSNNQSLQSPSKTQYPKVIQSPKTYQQEIGFSSNSTVTFYFTVFKLI